MANQHLKAILAGAPFAGELCNILSAKDTFGPVVGDGCFSLADLAPDYWVDLTDSAYLFQDAAATVPAVDDGDPVGASVARAGSLTLTQSTTARKPTLKTPSYRAGPSVQWDGIDDDLLITNFSNMDELPLSVLCVFRLDELASSGGAIANLARAGFVVSPFNSWRLNVSHLDDKIYWSVFQANGTEVNVVSDAATVVGQWYVVLGTVAADGSVVLYVDGAPQGAGASVTDMATGQSFFRLGCVTPALGLLAGDIAHFGFWNAALPASDATAIYEGMKP